MYRVERVFDSSFSTFRINDHTSFGLDRRSYPSGQYWRAVSGPTTVAAG
jgi:hypothetical protein